MIIVIGIVVVVISIFGGFKMGGGQLFWLFHPNELLIIGGGGLGSLIIMSPRKVLVDMGRGLLKSLQGTPYGRAAYEELLKVLYELFLLGRRNSSAWTPFALRTATTRAAFTRWLRIPTRQGRWNRFRRRN